jgi:transposase InsO family protein
VSTAHRIVEELGCGISRVCGILGVPRATYYRAICGPAATGRDTAIVGRMEHLVLTRPGYGSRRIARELSESGDRIARELSESGDRIGRRRVRRIMRENSLLCQLKKRWTRTTDSSHGHRRYPNLITGLELQRPDHVWVSDITYLRLGHGFCYLAVILDAFTRKVVSWNLSRQIDSTLTVAALRVALRERDPAAGWIHHSDQGVQYACRGYIEAILSHHGRPSMSSKAYPYDNAKAESFFATLKKEYIYQEEHTTFDQVNAGIRYYIDDYYNRHRMHSSLGYLSPEQFEAKLTQPQAI